jgi:hypothetical protein
MAYDEKKFANFNGMLRDSKAKDIDVVLIHHPNVLGDNYEELVENLNRLADAELCLSIAPRKARK